jgi:DNA polymerase family A
VQLPNIRSTIVPDPGYVLVEIDLKQADAQVVAWESSDNNLKSLFRRGVDIYTERETSTWTSVHVPRQIRKNCIHSVNYGAGHRTLAERYLGTEAAAKDFIANWFTHHPAIPEWHRRIAWEMQQSLTPTIRNIWGYRRTYACPTPLTQPLAWLGQSTVARINKEMLLAYGQHECDLGIQVLMPHHDSVLLQARERDVPDIFLELLHLADIVVPYDDPLIIPSELKWSDRSWGHMTKWTAISTA